MNGVWLGSQGGESLSHIANMADGADRGSPAGHQPMLSGSGRRVIVWGNGEIWQPPW